MKKRVRCVETGMVFESMREAGASIGQDYQRKGNEGGSFAGSNISHVLDKPNRTAGGFHWEFSEQARKIRTLYLEESLPKIYKEITRQPPTQQKVDYPPEGYVYIFRNRWHPEGVYKIGSTDNLQDRRSAARTWGPYDCEFYLEVNDCKLVESMVHEKLHDYRIEAGDLGKEHFSVDLEKATSIIKNVAFELACMHKDCAA